jgi:hypothetical protein
MLPMNVVQSSVFLAREFAIPNELDNDNGTPVGLLAH